MSTYSFDLTSEVAHNGTREVGGELLIDFNRAVDNIDTVGLWPADVGGVQSHKNVGARHGDIPTVSFDAMQGGYDPGWIDEWALRDEFRSQQSNLLDGWTGFAAAGWVNLKNAADNTWPEVVQGYAWGAYFKLHIWTLTGLWNRLYLTWWPGGGLHQPYHSDGGAWQGQLDEYHHCAVEWDGAWLHIYLDGQEGAGPWAVNQWLLNDNRFFGTGDFVALTDDVQVWDAPQWGGNFSPHRFEQGDGVLGHNFGAAQKLSEVAWTSDEGGWTVTGAGSDFVNGDYVPWGTHNGKTRYRKPYEFGFVYLYWEDARWNLQVVLGAHPVLYHGASLAALPAGPWVADDGAPPAPSLANGHEGDISKIEVYDCDLGAWVQVGGASPTSPIVGLEIKIADAVTDIIRVTMDPKADALQTETPKLLDLTVTYGPLGGGRIIGSNIVGSTIGRSSIIVPLPRHVQG